MSITLILPFGTGRSPAGARATTRRQPSAPRTLPAAPVLGLIDNGKVKARELLGAIGEALKARRAIRDYVIHSKTPSTTLSDAERDALLGQADIIISGLGDCGGCTACSTTDALRCREQGVPSFMLASTKFAFLVDATDREYGIGGLHRLYVDHPVWSRDDAWFTATAETLAGQVIAMLAQDVASIPIDPRTEAAPPEIDAALSDLRQGMDADGYAMTARREGDMIHIAVTRREGAGELCLMPRPAFVDLVASMLRKAGIDHPAGRIAIRYPASGA